MNWRELCRVNINLLPFKLHFFFVCGGYAGVMPFMPIIAKQLGINATAFGVGFSMIPIFIFLSNPLFGFLVDYFQNIKLFLASLIIAGVGAYFLVLGIPAINYDDSIYLRVSTLNPLKTSFNVSSPVERSCFEKILAHELQCSLKLKNKIIFSNSSGIITTDLILHTYAIDTVNITKDMFENEGDKLWWTFYTENVTLLDKIGETYLSQTLNCSPNITECFYTERVSKVFSSYQYWAFIAIAIVGAVTSASVSTLGSVGCYEKIGKNVEAYGRQRLFGTISWGLVCTLTGVLNDIEKAAGKPFLSGFYLMAIFMMVEIMVLICMDIPKTNMSSNMCKDLGEIFTSREILMFALGVLFVGVFNSIISVYEFWFLEDLGAQRKLLGMTIFMQCLVGEVPFLFFSGWFVDKLGHYLCLVAVFAAFAIRLTSYSLIENPWFALPVDTLHGVTFGLYHGAMTSFSKAKAPKGMEATLLGLFGGMYDGLGYGVGSFVGGIGLDYLGPRTVFFTAGMISFGCVLIFSLASYAFRSRLLLVPPETENSMNLQEKNYNAVLKMTS